MGHALWDCGSVEVKKGLRELTTNDEVCGVRALLGITDSGPQFPLNGTQALVTRQWNRGPTNTQDRLKSISGFTPTKVRGHSESGVAPCLYYQRKIIQDSAR